MIDNTIDTAEPTQSLDSSQSLTLNDLAVMKTIIDISSSRGAFKPDEMIVVGQTYNKLVAFLDQVKQATQPSEEVVQDES